MDELMKVPETAKLFGISEKTLWTWIYSRRIGVVRLGRAVRIKRSEIERIIEAGEIPAKA